MSEQTQPAREPNFTLTGDEARMLMMALATSTANLQANATISLWTRLNDISQVQPPRQPQPEPSN